MRAFVLSCFMLLVAAPATAKEQPPDLTPVHLGVGGQAVIYNLPLTVALEQGYFRDEGLDVKVIDFTGGGKAAQALVADAVQVVSGAYEHTLRLQARGQALQAFVLASESPQLAMGVSSRTLANYSSIADLRGKTIGISAPGSSTQMLANRVLAQGGLSIEDVAFATVGTGATAVQAMLSGKIDALVNAEPLISLLEQQQAIRLIADARTPAGTAALFGGPMPANTLYAKSTYIQNNPQTVQALTNAMLKALTWLHDATDAEVADLVPTPYLMGDAELYRQAFRNIQPSLSVNGRFPAEGARNALQALQSFDPVMAQRQINLRATWTNQFVDQATQP